MQQNFVTKLKGLDTLTQLRVLDLAYNKVEAIENMDNNKHLTDLWINKNKISEWSSVEYLKNFPELDTVYLIHNPVTNITGKFLTKLIKVIVEPEHYVDWIMNNVPSIQQIDSDSIMLIKKKKEM